MGAISKTSSESLADISASRLVQEKRRRSQTASIYLTRTGKHLLGFPKPSHSFLGKKIYLKFILSQCPLGAKQAV